MTDNRTTELREKLTERGVEYETNDHMGAFETRWNGFTAIQISENANMLMSVTPEQAIAATLGSGTCEIALARLVDVAAKVDIDTCAEILECVEAIRKAVKR